MLSLKQNIIEKQEELHKYRELVLATFDYYLENNVMPIKSADFNSNEHIKGLKILTEEHYQKGRLTRLKQWFRDLTEMPIETGDFKFKKYLKDKTKFEIDIFESYFKRVDKIIEKGRITTNNQFYDINIMVNHLCQTEPVDNNKIDILNRLLSDYEKRKPGKSKKPSK